MAKKKRSLGHTLALFELRNTRKAWSKQEKRNRELDHNDRAAMQRADTMGDFLFQRERDAKRAIRRSRKKYGLL